MLQLIHYPDKRLDMPAVPITVFGAPLHALANQLLNVMYEAPGLGITACHVGLLQQLVVIDLEKGKPQFFVNPRITWFSKETSDASEGSISMPGVIESVERPAAITYSYNDLDGTLIEAKADGFLSTCLQHEIDQLNGIFWLKRLSRLKRDRLIKKYSKRHVCAHQGCC